MWRNVYLLSYNFKSTISSMNSIVCNNLLNVVKENSANIDMVETRLYNNGAYTATSLKGDQTCSSAKKDCLKDINIEKIEQLCYNTKENVANFQMVIYLFR